MWNRCSDVLKDMISEQRIGMFQRARMKNLLYIVLFSETLGSLFGLIHIFPNRMKPTQSMPRIEDILRNEIAYALAALGVAILIWLIHYLKYRFMKREDKIKLIRNKIVKDPHQRWGLELAP